MCRCRATENKNWLFVNIEFVICYWVTVVVFLCDRTRLRWWRNSWLVTQKTWDLLSLHFAKPTKADVMSVVVLVCFIAASVSWRWHCFTCLCVRCTAFTVECCIAVAIPESICFSAFVKFCYLNFGNTSQVVSNLCCMKTWKAWSYQSITCWPDLQSLKKSKADFWN